MMNKDALVKQLNTYLPFHGFDIGEIEIDVKSGKICTAALLLDGVWAIHPTVVGPNTGVVGWSTYKWTLTHIPTGFAGLSFTEIGKVFAQWGVLLAVDVDWSAITTLDEAKNVLAGASKQTWAALKALKD